GALDHGTTTKPTPRPRRPPPPDEGAVAGPPPPQTAAPFAQLGAVSVGLRHGGGADDRPHPLAAAPGGGPAGGQPTVRGPQLRPVRLCLRPVRPLSGAGEQQPAPLRRPCAGAGRGR